jgi:hypothetical protein
LEGRASLKDDTGNSYSRCYFGISEVVGQVDDGESIYPEKSLSDCLVFELPTDTCQALFLELPASAVGGSGALRMKLPRSLWDGDARKREEIKQKREHALTLAEEAAESNRMEDEKKKKWLDKLRFRTWKSESGKFTIKAKFLRDDKEAIYLEKDNGKEITVKKDRLSKFDTKWIDWFQYVCRRAEDKNNFGRKTPLERLKRVGVAQGSV